MLNRCQDVPASGPLRRFFDIRGVGQIRPRLAPDLSRVARGTEAALGPRPGHSAPSLSCHGALEVGLDDRPCLTRLGRVCDLVHGGHPGLVTDGNPEVRRALGTDS